MTGNNKEELEYRDVDQFPIFVVCIDKGVEYYAVIQTWDELEQWGHFNKTWYWESCVIITDDWARNRRLEYEEGVKKWKIKINHRKL